MIDIITLIFLIALAWYIASKLPESKCNGDCMQGRNCTCKGQ
jgi:hypothetical protein